MSQKYSVILVPLCISFYFPSILFSFHFVFLLIIITLCISFVMVNNYVLHAYRALCAVVLWVGGVDVCNVGSPLSVCACFMGAPGGVLHAGCLNDNW